MWKIFAQVLFKFGFEKAGNNVLWKSIKQSNSHMLPFASDIPKSKSCIFYLEIFGHVMHFPASGWRNEKVVKDLQRITIPQISPPPPPKKKQPTKPNKNTKITPKYKVCISSICLKSITTFCWGALEILIEIKLESSEIVPKMYWNYFIIPCNPLRILH